MLLALDTATTTASLAFYDLTAGQLLAEFTWQARRRQTQDVLGEAQHMLALLGLTPRDLTALAVTTGPGSFTGVRIGISAAKGIGLGLPSMPRVIGVPTLSVTAAPWLAALATVTPAAMLCACIQAGRSRYNWAWFGSDDCLKRPNVREHQAGPAAELVAALAALAPNPVWLAGEVTPDMVEALHAHRHVLVIDSASGLRRAGHLARLAVRCFAAGIEDSLQALHPLYLRNP